MSKFRWKKGTQMFTVYLKAVENPRIDQMLVFVFITDPSKITSNNYSHL